MKKSFLVLSVLILASLACAMPRINLPGKTGDPTATPVPPQPTIAFPTEAPPQETEGPQQPTPAPQDPTQLLSDGELLFSDDFSDTSTNWDRSNNDSYISDYRDGKYYIKVNQTGNNVWANPNSLQISGGVDVTVDAWLDEGSSASKFGIVCGYQSNDNFHSLAIRSDGTALIEWHDLVEGHMIDSKDVTNLLNNSGIITLRAVCEGHDLTLYVNGQYALSTSSERLTVGNVGLLAGSPSDGIVAAYFDNFVVRSISAAGTNTPPSTFDDVLFSDNFDAPMNSPWDTRSSGNETMAFGDGMLVMTVNTSNTNYFSRSYSVNEADVNIEVDTIKISETIENDQGVFCRAQDYDNLYSFAFGTDGFVSIIKYQNGEITKLFGGFIDTRLTSAQRNRLRASCIGSTLTLYINGEQVASVTDSTFSSGDVGVFTGTYVPTPVVIGYDNFVVSRAH